MQFKEISLQSITFIIVRMFGLAEIFNAIINLSYLAESYMKFGNFSMHENWLIVRILMDLTWALFLLQKTGWIISLLQKGLETVFDQNKEIK